LFILLTKNVGLLAMHLIVGNRRL